MPRIARRLPLLVLASTLCFAAGASAQVSVTWSQTLTVRNASDVAIGPQDSIYFLGWGYGGASYDGLLTRIDPDGTVRWERSFDDGNSDLLRALAVDAQGNAIACGYSDQDPTAQENTNLAVVKFDADGNELWRRFVDNGPTGTEAGIAARLDAAGDIVVGGTAAPTLAGEDLAVWKYSPSGMLLWSTYADHAVGSAETGRALQLDSQGNALLAGSSIGAGGRRALLVKVAPDGTKLWQRAFLEVANGYSVPADLAIDAGDDVYCLCVTPAGAGNRVVIVKFDDAGTFVWQHDVTGPHSFDDAASDLKIDALGNVLATGYFRETSGGTEYFDGFITKVAPDGTTLWTNTVDGPTHARDGLGGILVDPSGDLYVSGSLGVGAVYGPSEAIVIRYDTNGVEKWRLRYDSPYFTPSIDGCSQLLRGGDGAYFGVGSTASLPPGSVNLPLIFGLDVAARMFCFGDGSGSACPCANESTPGLGAGCRNTFAIGARLTDSGVASLSADDFALTATGMPNSNVFFFQGSATPGMGAGTVFGDGLLCASGTTKRLATRPISGGTATYPLAGETPISIRGDVVVPGVRAYQALYRNAAPFCTPATFNTTNGVLVTWAP